MTWSPQDIDEKIEQLLERQDELLGDLLERGVLKDQCDAAYERAKRDAITSGKATGSNETERRARLLAVQVRPGETILDLRTQRDRSKTAYFDTRALIEKIEKQLELLQTLHVTHRNARASGPR